MIRYVMTVLVAWTMAASASASAQEIRGFALGGITRNVNAETFPTVGGGATVDVGVPWLAAGAQGETFFSWPYFAGRGAVFGQARVPSNGPVRALALAGAGFGEDAGPLFGGGVEFRPSGQRLGVRITLEDYLTTITPVACPASAGCAIGPERRAHQIAVRAGIVF